MKNTNYKNELTKRKFLEYLRASKGFKDGTVEAFEKAIWLWEDFTANADFSTFSNKKATDFKSWLKNKQKSGSQGKSIGISYCYDTLRHLKNFFSWLSKQKGYKKIIATDIDYLNLPKGEMRIATQSRAQVFPSLEEVRTAIEAIQGVTEVEKRDKALLSLTLLTGARISALVSFPMQSFNKENLTIDQDPKLGVKTKFSKRFVSSLIPFFYKESLGYFLTWIDYLKNEKKFKATDPIFPATKVGMNDTTLGYFSTEEVEPVFWTKSSSARKIFEKRFKQAKIKYYHPHTFRHLLVKEFSKLALTEEQKKAFSQSFGHEDVGTTFGTYGYNQISDERQIEIIRNIDFSGEKREVKLSLSQEEMKQLAKYISENNK